MRKWWVGLGGLVLLGIVLVSPAFMNPLTDVLPVNVKALANVGAAIISGAIVGGVLLAFEEHLEQRREKRDREIGRAQADREREIDTAQAIRDERTALLIQLASVEHLSDINLSHRDLRYVILRNRSMVHADFTGSDLGGADFSGSTLEKVMAGDFSGPINQTD